MSNKTVIVAIPHFEGKEMLTEVWADLSSFCKEYGLKYNTQVRKDFPFLLNTITSGGNEFEWKIDRIKVFTIKDVRTGGLEKET